jgi:hypothetical protein
MRIKMKTESIVGNLPISDGSYLGRFEGFRVTIPFDGFDVSFVVAEKYPSRELYSGAVTCKVTVTDGIALVEAK